MTKSKDKGKSEAKTPSAKNAPAKVGSKHGGLSRRGRFVIPCNPPRKPPVLKGKPVRVLGKDMKLRMDRLPL